MMNKFKLIAVACTITLMTLTSTAQAVPYTFEDPDHGTCDITGQNVYYYIYLCEDGALLYIPK